MSGAATFVESSLLYQNVNVVLAMIQEGLARIAFHCDEHFSHLEALATRYGDRKPDLADLCLIRMSELHPVRRVITVDRDGFGVYRRNKREVIPLAVPPL